MRLVLALALVSMAALVGCGGDNGVGGGPTMGISGPSSIPDGFVQSGCQTNDDCDDGNPCTVDTCPTGAFTCMHETKKCPSTDCAQGICDLTTGQCTDQPIADMTACMLANAEPGSCMSGACTAIPQCSTSFALDCSDFNKTTTGSTSGASVIDNYACATGETGPEKAYPFRVTTDRDITLSLTGTTSDLDLIVLAGNHCVATAACVAQSLTVGTGNETVTFRAAANTDYTIVVEGKAGAMGSYTLNIGCMGGVCAPIKQLACNMSIMGDTTGMQSTKVLSSYSCAPMEAGPEDTYTITQSTDTNYKMTLTGLTQDLDLIVLYDSTGCTDTFCKNQSTMTGTADETIAWQAYSGSTYDVIVDGKTAGGPYMLQVDCPPSCTTSNYLSCTTASDSRKNNDASKSKSIIDNWSCDPGTTGPEVVYQFYPSSSGMYTFTLDGLSADLDLIVVQGDYSTCDPSTMCVASSVTAGTASESVTFMADSSKVYYIAVDGKNGAVSPYNLKMKSALCPGASCYNSSNSLDCTYLEDTRKNNDSARSKNVVDDWACDPGTTGPEVVYKFTPPVNGTYQVDLDGLTADLDLVVVSNASAFSCDANAACVAQSVTSGTAAESLTFTADKTKTYYIGVDGKAGAVGNYHIKLSSAMCPAPVCKTGSTTLSCASPSLTTRNDASGATNDIASWTCDANTTGPELAHKFTPSASGMYTVQMIGLHADLDLIVLQGDATNSCSPSATCLTQSTNSGNADEKVTFQADAGKTYYLVVDGKNGAMSQYTLAVTDGCP
jgi:hypothetical protein